MTSEKNSKHKKGAGLRQIAIIFTLILAGEVIFLLPFIIPRVFRPTYLSVFDLTNLELGLAYSIYGTVAILAYLFGGPIADRFAARNLMAMAMVGTGLGGLYLLTIPSFKGLCILYGFWGLTTILLFWSALLRSTRVWGGPQKQGLAYGLLDGGRGLVGAIFASIAVAAFTAILVSVGAGTEDLARRAAMIRVIWIFSGAAIVTSIIIWLVIPGRNHNEGGNSGRQQLSWKEVIRIARDPAVWTIAIVVLCAYVSYKAIGDFSLYAHVVHGLDDVGSAEIGTLALWMRPVTAIIAGIVADRIRASSMVSAGFIVIAIGSAIITAGILPTGVGWTLASTVILATLGIYAVRAVYFALVSESAIPLRVTGTAIGVISAVGFLPDVFMGPIMGYFLDYYPGEQGHQLLFAFVGIMALGGFIAIRHYRSIIRRRHLGEMQND